MKFEQAIQEAIRVRRGGFDKWLIVRPNGDIVFENSGKPWIPTVHDLIADDWVAEDEKRLLSLKEILSIVKKASKTAFDEREFDQMVASYLGFKDS
jgi:hypothetical protein